MNIRITALLGTLLLSAAVSEAHTGNIHRYKQGIITRKEIITVYDRASKSDKRLADKALQVFLGTTIDALRAEEAKNAPQFSERRTHAVVQRRKSNSGSRKTPTKRTKRKRRPQCGRRGCPARRPNRPKRYNSSTRSDVRAIVQKNRSGRCSTRTKKRSSGRTTPQKAVYNKVSRDYQSATAKHSKSKAPKNAPQRHTGRVVKTSRGKAPTKEQRDVAQAVQPSFDTMKRKPKVSRRPRPAQRPTAPARPTPSAQQQEQRDLERAIQRSLDDAKAQEAQGGATAPPQRQAPPAGPQKPSPGMEDLMRESAGWHREAKQRRKAEQARRLAQRRQAEAAQRAQQEFLAQRQAEQDAQAAAQEPQPRQATIKELLAQNRETQKRLDARQSAEGSSNAVPQEQPQRRQAEVAQQEFLARRRAEQDTQAAAQDPQPRQTTIEELLAQNRETQRRLDARKQGNEALNAAPQEQPQRDRLADLLAQNRQAQQRRVDQQPEVQERTGAYVRPLRSGIPEFNMTQDYFAPDDSENFNRGIATVNSGILKIWNRQLAQITTTDTARWKALTPLVEAYSADNAPKEKLALIMQDTIAAVEDKGSNRYRSLPNELQN